MARLPRYYAPDLTQHVIQRGNNRTTTFRVAEDHLIFLLSLQEAAATNRVAVHAFALMKNHVHMLVTPETEVGLPRMMQSLGSRYVLYFNRRYQRTGGLFEGRYRAFAVDTDRYLLTCLRYIELNPVRAGVVKRPEEYEWSSYRVNAYGVELPLIKVHPLLKALWSNDAEREANYRHLCEAGLSDDELTAVRDAAQHGWALGGPQFVEVMQNTCGRPARRRRSGPTRS